MAAPAAPPIPLTVPLISASPEVKFRLLPAIQILAATAILVWIFGSVQVRENIGTVFANADWHWLAAAVFAAAVSELACAARWKILLGAFGIPLPFRKAAAFSFVGLFYSLGLPGSAGGDAVRSVYAMQNHPNRKLAAAFSVLADRFCGLAALSLALGAALAFEHRLLLSGTTARTIVLAAAALSGGAVLLLLLWWATTIPRFRDFVSRRHPRMSRRLLESSDIFKSLARRPGAVAAAVGISLASFAAHFLCYFFSARAFGADLGIGQVFTVMPVVDSLTMLPITLYGLGLREALLTVLLGRYFGIPAAAAAMVSLGGFGAQALVALSGAALLPFIRTADLGSGANTRSVAAAAALRHSPRP